MAGLSSFFIYSPRPPEDAEQKGHILFNVSESGWVAVNDTGLEIAGRLDGGIQLMTRPDTWSKNMRSLPRQRSGMCNMSRSNWPGSVY